MNAVSMIARRPVFVFCCQFAIADWSSANRSYLARYMRQYLREFDWRYNVRQIPDAERSVIALRMTTGKRLTLKSTKG